METSRRRRPAAGTVLGALALFIALGGPAEAAKLIDGSRIRKGSITARAIKPGVLTGRLMRVATIPGDRLMDRSIALSKFSPDAMAQLTRTPADEVTGTKVLDHSLGGADVADESLGQSQIARDGVGSIELAEDTVDSDEVVDGRLAVRDVASFAGSVSYDFPSVPPSTCTSVDVAAEPISPRQGLTIADDAVLVTPAPGLPPELMLHARPAGSATIRISACNIRAPGAGNVIDPPAADLHYLSFDF